MKKNMKKLLVIVMALMPSLSICSFAQEGGGTIPDDDSPINPITTGTTPRPRFMPDDYDDIPIIPMPSPTTGHEPRIRNTAQAPYCYHSAGVVYIEADSSITYINASVTRYADNQVWSNAASGNTLSITASDSSGEYYLELTLSSGQSYIGKYIIE